MSAFFSRALRFKFESAQIADLLGHRSLDTTAIYAKVDLASLKQVALPWPTSPEVRP